VQEYVEAGSLADLFRAEGPRLDPGLVVEMVRELSEAIEHLHERELWHRDIKPANILVRTRAPELDLVLTDFGLAVLAVASQAYASTQRTTHYAAPEAQWNRVGPFRDYWSLGMIVLEAITGKMPFAGVDEYVINRMLGEGEPFDLSEVPDDRWRLLIEGLLTWDADRRWGASEVANWLHGGSPEVHRDTVRGRARPVPYLMPSGECHTLPELAAAIAEDWEEGTRRWARGWITEWLQSIGTDHNLLSRIVTLSEGQADLDLQVYELLLLLDPARPPTWHGHELTPARIASLCRDAISGDEEAREVVLAVRQRRLLARHTERTDDAASRHLDADLTAELDRYDAAVARQGSSWPAELRPRAAEWVLASLVDPTVLDQLVERSAEVATPDARARRWYRDLGDSLTASPGLLVALLQLGPEAEAETRGARAEQIAAAERAAQQQRADDEQARAASERADEAVTQRRRQAGRRALQLGLLVALTALVLPDLLADLPRFGTLLLFVIVALAGGLGVQGLAATYPVAGRGARTLGQDVWAVAATLVAVTAAQTGAGGVRLAMGEAPFVLDEVVLGQVRVLPWVAVIVVVLSAVHGRSPRVRGWTAVAVAAVAGVVLGGAYGGVDRGPGSWWTQVANEGLSRFQWPVFAEFAPWVLAGTGAAVALLFGLATRTAMRTGPGGGS
jgi:hypothetical protein